MKTLLLMRHAKAKRDAATGEDRDRPLKRRGKRAAEHIGRWLAERDLVPERVLCSDAMRTRETLEHLSRQWPHPVEAQFLADLYLCPAEGIGEAVRQFGGENERLMIVGHNPGLEQFLAITTGRPENFVTSGVAVLKVDAASWAAFQADSSVTLELFQAPSELD